MVYDPDTGLFGDVFDPDSGLFDSAVDSDPFTIPTDDVQDDRHDEPREWSQPSSSIPSGTVGSISYDRGDNEIVGRPTEMDRDNGVRSPRQSADERRASEERRDRERADTGSRNVRRAAGQHSGEPGEGSSRDTPVASNLADAAARLRADIQPTGDERTFDPGTGTLSVDRGVDGYVKALGSGVNAGSGGHRAPVLTRTTVPEAPTFVGVDFECEMYAVKMNSSGDWLVTFKVPFRHRSAITELSGAAGMNLKTRMELDGFAD